MHERFVVTLTAQTEQSKMEVLQQTVTLSSYTVKYKVAEHIFSPFLSISVPRSHPVSSISLHDFSLPSFPCFLHNFPFSLSSLSSFHSPP